MDNARVLIVANDPLTRAGLSALLNNQPGCVVVGQVAGDADLLAEIDVYRPDVTVWDLGWDPLAALDHLADLGNDRLPILALLADETCAANVWAAGVHGLLLRDAGIENLVAALQAIVGGLVALDPGLAQAILPTGIQSPGHLIEELTPREIEVLQLLAEGLPNKTIAHRLDISEHTVKFHVNAILSKLGAQNRTEAVVRATRLGLIIL